MKKYFVLATDVMEAEEPKDVLFSVGNAVKEELDNAGAQKGKLTLTDITNCVLRTLKYVSVGEGEQEANRKSAFEKLRNIIFADKEVVKAKREAFIKRLEEGGFGKYEYRDWTTMKKGDIELTLREEEFEISSGIAQSRCDYSDVELPEDRPNDFYIGNLLCECDVKKEYKKDPIGTVTVSKEDLIRWMEGEREGIEESDIPYDKETLERVLGHFEEEFDLLEVKA